MTYREKVLSECIIIPYLTSDTFNVVAAGEWCARYVGKERLSHPIYENDVGPKEYSQGDWSMTICVHTYNLLVWISSPEKRIQFALTWC